MAINKAQTPVWMKAVLVVLAIVFVFGFISIGASPFMTDATQQQTTTPAAGSLDAVNQQFQPTVSALTAQLQSDPESYTVLVSLGNTYFDWAAQLQQASQTTTANVGADQPIWVAAKDAYSRALAVKEGESPVTVDYAITLFYTGETTKAIKTATDVTKADPEFAQAYLNLGIFNKVLGQSEEALANYEKFLELDPDGATGNTEFVESEIAALKGGATAAPSTP